MTQIAVRLKPNVHIRGAHPVTGQTVSGPCPGAPNGGYLFTEEEAGRRMVAQGWATFCEFEEAEKAILGRAKAKRANPDETASSERETFGASVNEPLA